MKQLTKTPIEG